MYALQRRYSMIDTLKFIKRPSHPLGVKKVIVLKKHDIILVKE